MGKDYFNYFIQGFDSKVVDLVKQIGFYPYDYIDYFEKFKEQLPSKQKLYSSQQIKN